MKIVQHILVKLKWLGERFKKLYLYINKNSLEYTEVFCYTLPMNNERKDIRGLFMDTQDAGGIFDDIKPDQKEIFEEDYGLDEETAERAAALMDEEGLGEDEAAEIAEWM